MTYDSLLTSLDRSVTKLVQLVSQVDEDFYDGHQTSREMLSHLVFWHREYVAITEALVNGRSPHLRQSTFIALNARSVREFQRLSMAQLCQDFLKYQQALRDNLCQLYDWEIEFPVKKGCRWATVPERLQIIQEHVDGHLARLERACRHGEAWVEAYYPSRDQAHA
ncbi:MAG: hypothetical protein IAF02_02925 [Anaerolineae bacterium]|nr:hypothetical protein [Anaerolineae bacterium]